MIFQEKTYKNWPQIPRYPYRTLIIGGSGSGKTTLLNQISHKQDIVKNLFVW